MSVMVYISPIVLGCEANQCTLSAYYTLYMSVKINRAPTAKDMRKSEI